MANAQWVTLFDAVAGSTGKLRISFTDQLNVAPGFGAASHGIIPEGNCSCTVSLPTFSQTYANPTAAKVAMRTMRANLRQVKLHLRYTEGTDVDFYPNGSLKSMEYEQQGATVEFNLVFQTEDVTATAPTN